MDTKTFHHTTEEAMKAWLEDFNGTYNIYWSVNPPLHDLNKKASREDIKEVAYLHVDIDPRAGEPLEQEQKRCLALLGECLPSTVPAPTIIVFSGGGYQAFWKLAKPIPINGDLTRRGERRSDTISSLSFFLEGIIATISIVSCDFRARSIFPTNAKRKRGA